MNSFIKFSLCLLVFLQLNATSFAFEHEDSDVHFLEYDPNVIQKNRFKKKPYFLLFAAQWCHWCHVFNEKTLTDEKVISYLNENFVNVFIDADINTSAYQKYKAKGVPFTVFLNPDTSEYYKYSKTLYAEPFLEVIQDVIQNVKQGKTVDGEKIFAFEYNPPTKFNKSTLDNMRNTYIKGVLDNFDTEEYGVGNGIKTILPETFLYLIKSTKGENRQDSVLWISETLKKAIENIYDPIEGGFFRYAETDDWKIPHYEKMAGLNAGTVLLLYKVNEENPNPKFIEVAQQSIHYLSNTLYDEETGSFLSFQAADTSYYFLNENRRKNVKPPLVISKVFTDHLAVTLTYFLDVLDYSKDNNLEKKVIHSLDFLSGMILNNKRIYHFYTIKEKQWRGKSGLQDHVLLAKLFQRAADKFQNESYNKAYSKMLRFSKLNYYDEKKQIFVDPELDTNDYEYLMAMNGDIVFALMGQSKKSAIPQLSPVKPIITYFSGLHEFLEDKFWDSKSWDFLERSASFLSSADSFLATQSNP